MTYKDEFKEYLKVRMAVVASVALVVTTSTLGLIDLMTTVRIEALPLYLHAGVGALAFPLSVFLLEYRGLGVRDALKGGFIATFGLVFFVVVLSEGAGKLLTGLLDMSASTFFYSASVGLISATIIVMWFVENHGGDLATQTQTRAPARRN